MKKVNILGYNLIDLILLGAGLVATTTVSIVFKSPWYVVMSSALGILCVFTQAKGKVATQFIGVVYFCFYIFIAYTERFYGEAILYLVVMIPIYIYGIIHWLKNRDKKDNVVIVRSNLPLKEWILMIVGVIALSFGVYYLLKALNTAELIVSTLSFVSMIPSVYLLARRCKWNQVSFLINDFILPVLWLLTIVDGNYALIPMCIGHLFQIVYDIYGLVNWIKLEKQQSEMKKV